MSKAQLVITAVVLEGRSKSAVARDYDVSRFWVQQLVKRYKTEGSAAFASRSRRPRHNPRAVDAGLEEKIVRLGTLGDPWSLGL
jgi:transposase